MKIKTSLGADAGNISVLDSAFITENGGLAEPEARLLCSVGVEPGKYRVKISIPETYRGKAMKDEIVEVKGNRIIIGDACYNWSSGKVEHDVWMKFLDKTEYLKNFFGRGICVDTGGDGEFNVVIDITPI